MKKAVEAYWGGKLSADELTKAAADVKKASWTSLKERGVEVIPRYIDSFLLRSRLENDAICFLAVTSPSTTTSLITLPRSTLSPSVTSARVSPLSMSTSPWAVAVRPRASTSPLAR